MQQSKISFEESQLNFIKRHKSYGFKDKSSLVRDAVERLRKEIEDKELEKSAKLYAELYEEDPEIREMAEASIAEWPE